MDGERGASGREGLAHSGDAPLNAHGYKIVAHVHDEIVCEAPAGTVDLDEFKQIITALPDWAVNMPMAMKVRKGDRFCEIKPPAEIPVSEPREAHGVDAEEAAEPVKTCNVHQDTENSGHYADDTCDSDDNTTDDTRTRNRDGYPAGEDRAKDSFGPSFIYRDENGQPYLRVTRMVRAGKKAFPNSAGKPANR